MSKMDKGKVVETDADKTGAEGQEPKPLRYVNPHYTIGGVPARDLTADEAAKHGATIAAAQAASRVVIYQEAE